MLIDHGTIEESRQGNPHALHDVFLAKLERLHALGDLLATAGDNPENVDEKTVRRATWWIVNETEDALALLSDWYESFSAQERTRACKGGRKA